ncbi:MAG: deoxyribodipyrimidine photo-lyase [Hyphomicrobiaceae bacterium]|nr:deoxyribodipyrimidine photo-lyase [Hyphomicrobiaceae bacterium]
MTLDHARPIIVWFRRELRLADHAALRAAAESGAPVLPLYVHDDETPNAWRPGGASRWWLHESLTALDASLDERGGKLVVRRGRTRDVLSALLEETNAGAVHATRSYEPFGTGCERDAAALCEDHGAAFRLHPGRVLFEPEDIVTKDGRPYRVFTPFWKACLKSDPPPAPKPVPHVKSFAKADSVPLGALGLLPSKPDWAGGLRETWRPGETAAQAALTAFIDDRMSAYADRRDDLFGATTSRLSPHLHFGEIGPAQVWHAMSHAVEASKGQARRSAETFLKELGWREFSYHLLHSFPGLPDTPLRPAFAQFPWRGDAAALSAWQRGQTGYPVVDAAMRQLWATGWMPNRARMIVASFLVKHLLLPWQEGEAWFWDTLVDADLANNAASWQWVAGCGADAAPYFRIFNPILQGRKFDPEGTYVRNWVPELTGLPAGGIHAPWEFSQSTLASAGIELGQTYPEPIVDHAAARARALRALEEIK